MQNRSVKVFLYTIFIFMLAAIVLIGAQDLVADKKEFAPVFSYTNQHVDEDEIKASVEKFLAIKREKENENQDTRMLAIGGETFGVKMLTDGVVIAGTTELSLGGAKYSPAYEGGLRAGDTIISINGSAVKGVGDVTRAIDSSKGEVMIFICRRNGKEQRFKVRAAYSEESGKYKLGIWIRDNTAGIGTVTYIDPTTGDFGGLGHGIYDVDTGTLMPLYRGVVTDVTITGIIKGEQGKPGEIRGYLKNSKRGALLQNNDCGVFGIYAPAPSEDECELIPVGNRREICEGSAHIRCTLDDTGVKEYSVEIRNIDFDASGTKCFTIHVSDPALLEKTGGIVQGMSGSPIIQNGKLVGAVTHVLINDPTTGYGIFIENMLDQMKK